MPDMGGRQKRGIGLRLRNAHDAGQLVLVRCQHCNIKRWYQPGDLIKLFGNAEVDQLTGAMVCVKCGLKEYILAESESLTARERMNIRVRRLAGIRMVRRVIWEDEGP